MKMVANLLKLAVLVGALGLLVGGPKATRAQWTGDQCVTYDKYNEPCASCCTNASAEYINEIEGVTSGCGTQSDYLTASPCGQAVPGGCGVDCTGQYDQAMDDPACAGGGQNGAQCPPMGNCCSPLICRSKEYCFGRRSGVKCRLID